MAITGTLATGAAALPALTQWAGIPTRSEIGFSPRYTYSNHPTAPTLYKLAGIRVTAGGTGYANGDTVQSGATTVGSIIIGDATEYGAAGVIACVRVTNDLGLTLATAPALTITTSGGSGATLSSLLVDQEAARASFGASSIEWTYIGVGDYVGQPSPGTDAAFLAHWTAQGYKPTPSTNSKPYASGLPIPPAGYGQPNVSAAVSFGGATIDAANSTYGNGVGYADITESASYLTKGLLARSAYDVAGSGKIMVDDPDFHVSCYNVATFSASAIAGFPTWLAANTTGPQRTADGLDASASILGGYDYQSILRTWYVSAGLLNVTTWTVTAAATSAGWSTPDAVHNANRRTIQPGATANVGSATPGYNLWRKYLRSSLHQWFVDLRATRLPAGAVITGNTFCALPVSPAYSVGGFVTVQAVYSSVAEYVDYGTGEWNPASTLDVKTSWALMAPEFVLHAYSMRAVGKFLTGPQVSPNPVRHSAAWRRTFLRQSVGFVRALGAAQLPCWDAFVQFATTAGATTTWREFMAAADYGGSWEFIAANPGLYDGYEQMPLVGVAVNADTLARIGSGAWPRPTYLMDAVLSLLAAGVPFAINAYSSLDSPAARVSALDAGVQYILSQGYSANPTISEAQTADSWCAAASAADLAAASRYWVARVTGSTGDGRVYAIPRVNATAGKIAVHVCNLQIAANGAAVNESALTVQLNAAWFSQYDVTAIKYAPGAASVPLAVTAGSGVLSIPLGAVTDLGCIVDLTCSRKSLPNGSGMSFLWWQ